MMTVTAALIILSEPVSANDIGRCNKGTVEEKLAACSRLIAKRALRGKNLAAAYINRGIAHSSKNDYDLAISDYSAAIKLTPTSSAAFSNRGNAYFDKREYDLAISDYNEASRLRSCGQT